MWRHNSDTGWSWNSSSRICSSSVQNVCREAVARVMNKFWCPIKYTTKRQYYIFFQDWGEFTFIPLYLAYKKEPKRGGNDLVVMVEAGWCFSERIFSCLVAEWPGTAQQSQPAGPSRTGTITLLLWRAGGNTPFWQYLYITNVKYRHTKV